MGARGAKAPEEYVTEVSVPAPEPRLLHHLVVRAKAEAEPEAEAG
jgi:hypothetical protein